jgi:hypothetical protein
MQVSIDGGETWIEASNVRVVYDHRGENEDQELLVNLGEEGVILDQTDADGEVIATGCIDLDGLEGMTA